MPATRHRSQVFGKVFLHRPRDDRPALPGWSKPRTSPPLPALRIPRSLGVLRGTDVRSQLGETPPPLRPDLVLGGSAGGEGRLATALPPFLPPLPRRPLPPLAPRPPAPRPRPRCPRPRSARSASAAQTFLRARLQRRPPPRMGAAPQGA